MKTIIKVVTPIVTALSLVLISTTSSQAKTAWHNGTPKILRGVWRGPDGSKVRIATAKGLYYGPKMGTKKTTYKYLGHYRYLVKLGSEFKYATVKFRITKHKLYDYSSKITYTH